MTVRIDKGPWPIRPLGEVCEVLDRLRRPVNAAERATRLGPYPYYGANGQVGTIDDFIFDEPLVLVAEDGGFFHDPLRPISYRVSGKCWVNNHAHVLRCLEGIDPDWLCHALAYQDVSHLVKGATRPKLNQKELREIAVPVPTPDEQRRVLDRIAECLGRCDELDLLRGQNMAAAEALPNAVRHDVWEDAARICGLTKLRELASDAKNGLYKHARYHGSGTILLRMFNVSGGQMVFERLERLETSVEEREKYALAPGDLLVSRVNSRDLVGKSALFPGLEEPAVFEAMLIRLTPKFGIAPALLGHLMNAPQFLHDLRGRAKHAIGQSSINQDDLLDTGIPDIRRANQDLLSETVDQRIAAARALSTTMADIPEGAHLRISILRRAFAGEL